jgi:ATP-dependent Clp protease protease subunit
LKSSAILKGDCKEDKTGKDEPSLDKEIQESFIKKRRVFLWKAIDDESAEKIIKQLLFLDEKAHEDIYFFLNSPGGIITSGLAIYDCMQAIKSKVRTIICGQAASMGAILSTGGAKGKRYAWPNSRIMIHQPLISGQVYGPAQDIQIQAEELLKIRETLNNILAKHSGKTPDQIEIDTDRDNYMTAEEAKNYGLID